MNNRYLLTPSCIRTAFAENAQRAKVIHLAVAWARPGWAAECLRKCNATVHAIVGTSFGATHPDTLQLLLDHKDGAGSAGAAWLAKPQNDGVFHPKLYVFSNGRDHSAIIGSVNLTNAAFMSNPECAVLTNLTSREYKILVDRWDQWVLRKGTVMLTKASLSAYRENDWVERRGGLCPPSLKRVIEAEDLSNAGSTSVTRTTRPGLLSISWKNYLSQLKSAMALRKNGETLDDYLRVIRDVRPLLLGSNGHHKEWSDADVLGRRPSNGDPEYGHFGRLTANGRSRLIITDRRFQSGIRSRLECVAGSESDTTAMSAA